MFTDEGLWVAATDALLKIDPSTAQLAGEVGRSRGLRDLPFQTARNSAGIWVTTVDEKLFLVDPVAESARRVGVLPLDVVELRANEQGLWISLEDFSDVRPGDRPFASAILRLHPQTGELIALVWAPATMDVIEADERGVWTGSTISRRLWHFPIGAYGGPVPTAAAASR